MHVRGVSFTALICALFLIGGVVFRTSAVVQPASVEASTPQQEFNRTVVPYWRVDEGLDSLVTLNNSLNRPREVLVTLYGEEGQVLAEASQLLEPRETRQLSASRLLGRPKEAHWGWLEISQAGHAYDIGVLGQVWDRHRQVTLDVPGRERPDFKSSRLVGLAPSAADNELIVINTADDERRVKLVVRSGSSVLRRQSTLSPKQVWRIQLNKMIQRPSGAPLLVSLEAGNGVAGDVMGGILWGGVDSVASGYIGLADPALRVSSRLSMTNLYGAQRRTTEHPLALQNTGSSPLSVQAVLTLGGNDREPVRRSMQWDLMPYGGRTIPLERDLERARGDWESATLDLQWDGPPDALLAHSYSIDSRRGLALRNPLVDPQQERKKASNYPLHVGNGYNTRISIKNPTDEPRRFIGHYFLEGGEEYGTGVVTIPPGETHVIDLAQLQRETIPDRFQRTLPPGELRGQFLWFPLKSPYRLIGRAVTELEGSGMVASLSCFQCDTPVPEFIRLTPADIAIEGFAPGSLEQHTVDALQSFRACEGGWSFDEEISEFVDFSSNNTSVATVAPGGNITVRAPGQATIEGSFEFEREICNLATCEPVIFGVITVVATSLILAQEPAPVITSVSPSRGLVGVETTVEIRGSNLGSSPTVLVGGSGVTATITSTSATKITAKLNASSNAGLGNHSIRVSTGGGTSNSKNFFVQKPTSFKFLTASQVASVCASNAFSFEVRALYQVLDQVGNAIIYAGMIPREHVVVSGQTPFPGFMPFANPQTTNSIGGFTDVPVGTCFGFVPIPFPLPNLCVDVVQTFDITTPAKGGGTQTFAIGTVTTRRDCVKGIRLRIQNGNTVVERILGTVN